LTGPPHKAERPNKYDRIAAAALGERLARCRSQHDATGTGS
jgi:hypothetical protein